MIEQGLVLLIQSGLGSPPLAAGGFPGQLPKDSVVPAYVYKVVSDRPWTTLQSVKGLTMRRFQFDCFGATALLAQQLANLIDAALQGFRGVLSDPDSTYVDSCLREDRQGPDYSDSVRNYWVMLEYEIWFAA